MKFRLLLITIFFCLQLYAQTDSLFIDPVKRDNIENFKTPVSAQRQIITAQQIKLSTCNRLSDVLQLIDGWTFASVNGDRWYAQANGTSSYHSQDWVLMVNGQKVVVNQYEAVNLNLLGIPVYDIERVEVINTPGIYLNEYSDKGLIHIITKKMPEGFFEKAFINQGYSSQTDGEVGINFSNTIGYAGKQNQFKLNTTYQDYFARDETVRDRYAFANSPMPIPKNTLMTLRPELLLNTGRWKHSLSGNYTRNDEFTFYTPGQYEKFNNQHYVQGSYLLAFNQSHKHHYRLSLQYSEAEYQSPNSLFMIPEHQRLINGNLNHTYHFTKRKQPALWRNGIAVDYSEYLFIQQFGNNSYLIKPYTTLSVAASRKSIFTADAMLVRSAAQTGYKASIGIYKRVDVITNWNLIASYSQRVSDEGDNMFGMLDKQNRAIGDWINYIFPQFAQPPLVTAFQRSSPKQFTADFYYNLTIGNNFKFIYNIGEKSLWEQYHWSYLEATQLNKQVHNLINRIYMYYDVFTNMVLQFHYMRTDKLRGDDVLSQIIPKHKFSVALEYSLRKTFKIYSRLNAQSKTVWEGAIWDFAKYGFFPQDGYTPEMWIWDAGISKPILKDKLQFNIAVRNLLNTREQYHPLGANLGLSVFASALLNLEAINFKKKQ